MKNYSFSQFSLYEECPRKFYYTYKKDMLSDIHPGALFSSLVHTALAEWYTGIVSDTLTWEIFWQKCVTKDPRKPALWDTFYSLDLAKQIVDKYIVEYGKVDKEKYKVISVESDVLIDLGNDHGFRVKPDVVLEDSYGKWVMDYKVSKQDKIAVLFDRQLLGQMVGHKAQGIIRVGIKVTPPTKKEPLAKISIERTHLQPSSDIIEEWWSETRLTGNQIELSETTDIWPKRAPQACYEFRRECAFLHVCEMGVLRDSTIEAWPKLSRLESYKES